MKLPLRFGLPLLLALLAGLAVVDGLERTALLVAAMGVALWSALSLPRPPPPEEAEEAEDALEQLLELDPGADLELDAEEPQARENKEAETPPGEGNLTENPDPQDPGERK